MANIEESYNVSSPDQQRFRQFIDDVRSRLRVQERPFVMLDAVRLPLQENVPRRWLDLELRDGDDNVVTLRIRADNLYLTGFRGGNGKWFELQPDNGGQPLIQGSSPLAFNGSYAGSDGIGTIEDQPPRREGEAPRPNVRLGRPSVRDAIRACTTPVFIPSRRRLFSKKTLGWARRRSPRRLARRRRGPVDRGRTDERGSVVRPSSPRLDPRSDPTRRARSLVSLRAKFIPSSISSRALAFVPILPTSAPFTGIRHHRRCSRCPRLLGRPRSWPQLGRARHRRRRRRLVPPRSTPSLADPDRRRRPATSVVVAARRRRPTPSSVLSSRAGEQKRLLSSALRSSLLPPASPPRPRPLPSPPLLKPPSRNPPRVRARPHLHTFLDPSRTGKRDGGGGAWN